MHSSARIIPTDSEIRARIDSFLDDRVEARRRQDGSVASDLRLTILRNLMGEAQLLLARRAFKAVAKTITVLYPELADTSNKRPAMGSHERPFGTDLLEVLGLELTDKPARQKRSLRANGEEIARLRRAKGLTQGGLAAQALKGDVGPRTIVRVESGKNADLRTLKAIADKLGVPLKQITLQ